MALGRCLGEKRICAGLGTIYINIQYAFVACAQGKIGVLQYVKKA